MYSGRSILSRRVLVLRYQGECVIIESFDAVVAGSERSYRVSRTVDTAGSFSFS